MNPSSEGNLLDMQCASKPAAVERAQAWLEEHEEELIEDTRGLLRIPSVEGDPGPGAPFGKEVRQALDFALGLGEKWGMRTRDVEGFAGHAEFGDSERLVMALGHLDVVPAGDGWKHEPFGAEIDGEYLYSRGAIDDKGPTMAALYAARALKETAAGLAARVRVVFGCNEESGFRCVKRYFAVEEAPTYGLAPDSGWPLYHAEKGIANIVIRVPLPRGDVSLLQLDGGERPNVVPDKARALLEVASEAQEEARQKLNGYWDRNVRITAKGARWTIKASGKAAHGSAPFAGDNAIVRALRAVLEATPPTGQKEVAKLLEIGHPSGVGLGIHGCDDVSRDLTTNLGIVRTNNGSLLLTVNVRYPVTWDATELRDRCEAFLKEKLPDACIEKFDDSPPLFFPADQEPVKTILEVYRAETDDQTPPGVMGGGTYARAVPNTVSIGTGWDGDGPAHEHDERVKVPHLLKMARIYAHILYRLAHEASK